jgi:hypothetical protein
MKQAKTLQDPRSLEQDWWCHASAALSLTLNSRWLAGAFCDTLHPLHDSSRWHLYLIHANQSGSFFLTTVVFNSWVVFLQSCQFALHLHFHYHYAWHSLFTVKIKAKFLEKLNTWFPGIMLEMHDNHRALQSPAAYKKMWTWLFVSSPGLPITEASNIADISRMNINNKCIRAHTFDISSTLKLVANRPSATDGLPSHACSTGEQEQFSRHATPETPPRNLRAPT